MMSLPCFHSNFIQIDEHGQTIEQIFRIIRKAWPWDAILRRIKTLDCSLCQRKQQLRITTTDPLRFDPIPATGAIR
jgi:hypothetical protein